MAIQNNPKEDIKICLCLEEEINKNKNIKSNQKEWALISYMSMVQHLQ